MNKHSHVIPRTQSTRPTRLSHLDETHQPTMVDVGAKNVTERLAVARALVWLPLACRRVLAAGGDTAKGNVLQVARLAGIMAAKRTAELIPLCHQLPLDGIDVALRMRGAYCEIIATARCHGRTGVEMEALTAAAIAALTVYDMLKALSHDLVIESVALIEKRGGQSGLIKRRSR